MLKKIRSLAYQYALPAAVIIFVLFDLLLLGIGRLLSLLPETLIIGYVNETILILLPIALVFFFGFSRAFKKGSFFRGLLCVLPFLVLQLIILIAFLSETLGNPEVNWNPWYLSVYGVFTVVGVGIREECVYRATIQNVLAKKYAGSVGGIWIAVGVSSILFGLSHVSNLFFGMDPLAVLTQVIFSTCVGVLFGAAYLRSGSIWALIFVHTFTDIAGLAESTFIRNVSDIEDMNKMSFSWEALAIRLVYVGIAIFLLRPSKCKQISESLCFADEELEAAVRT